MWMWPLSVARPMKGKGTSPPWRLSMAKRNRSPRTIRLSQTASLRDRPESELQDSGLVNTPPVSPCIWQRWAQRTGSDGHSPWLRSITRLGRLAGGGTTPAPHEHLMQAGRQAGRYLVTSQFPRPRVRGSTPRPYGDHP